MSTFNPLGFEVVKGLIQPETARLLAQQFKMTRDVEYIKNNVSISDVGHFTDSQCENTYAKGRLIIFDSLLPLVKDKMEQVTGKTLLPTYSFARIYYAGSELTIHRDRPACECSVTVCIENDSTNWPICIKDRAGNSHSVPQQPGDALVYSGHELEHWRDVFRGQEHVQCFLHFVDANGPYADQIYDGRKALGLR